MRLTHRPTTLQDLESCLPLIRNGFAFGPDERPHLLALWEHLLAGDMAESAVIEDQERQAGDRIVGFGLSVFATDEFAAEARTHLSPYQACHVLERWRRGNPPFLSYDQIRRANATDGVNIVVLHAGTRDAEASASERSEIGYKIIESFMAHHSGYHVKSFQHEVYGQEREGLLSIGCFVENDHAPFRESALGRCHRDRHPYLMGMSRRSAQEGFNYFHSLFFAPPPCLFFRHSEQTLLKHALLGRSDAEIAEMLGLSLFTIHKRWRGIYARVADRDLTLLPDASDCTGRGAEKRTVLLHYLQQHPEELRPFTPPGRVGTAGPDAPAPGRRGSAPP